MRVDCEGCAGCCLDWRPLAPDDGGGRRGPREPLDDVYNLVPLTRDEVVAFVERGVGDAMVPRMWAASEERAGEGVEIDGVDVAAIGGRPAFFVGLRKPPKPVAPFGHSRRWLRSCVFLDPETLQCRIHGDDEYPAECAEYPGHNLALEQETECERVESAFGGERLLDDEAPEGQRGLLLGPQAVGSKVFAHPDPSRLGGAVERMRRGDLTAEDRAEFVGVAAGSRPGSVEVNEERAERTRAEVLETESWVSDAVEEWTDAAGELGSEATDAPVGAEEAFGAPETPGWDAVRE
ncbi:YkgJ family cysteine cluster protein [Halopelagius fulvigenes]|uniref:YkgJ family cysteine cluster protein n=1 Tax=Halopelagius fulvigenes TaxID=1198324 RepID=A0ABD5U7E6_9EURY